MRWFKIEQATIDPKLRKDFEMNGVMTVQMALANKGTGVIFQDGIAQVLGAHAAAQAALWIAEQHRKSERKETWSLTMEVAITILVAFELIVAVAELLTRTAAAH